MLGTNYSDLLFSLSAKKQLKRLLHQNSLLSTSAFFVVNSQSRGGPEICNILLDALRLAVEPRVYRSKDTDSDPTVLSEPGCSCPCVA